ncbi:MAG TPA: BTAD domain-containing putative transcriptional regulator, partial [Anaerolineae bacterium]|nr:BTAD domain-containing putative transcriptional regulator [Anaerolineae bacterium]
IQLHRSFSYQYNLAVTLNDYAEIMQARGQMTRAIQVQREALEIWRQRGTPAPLAIALHHIAQGMHMLGQYQVALATYAEALNWAERSGNPRWEAIVLAGQGDLLADIGDVHSALDLFRQAMLKAEQCHDRNIVIPLYRSIARCERWLHNFTDALKWVSAAEAESLQASEVSKLDLGGLHGILLVEIGSRAEGRKILEGACSVLERADRPADLAQTLLFRGYAEFLEGDQPAAIVSLEQSFRLADSLGYEQMLLSEALSVREMLTVLSSNAHIGRRVTDLISHAEAARSSQKHIQPDTIAPPGNQNSALTVRALGQTRVMKNNVEIQRTAWASQKTRELFLFLVDRSPIARDEVLAVFWPDMTTSRAVSNLHQTLYRLRRAVADDLILTDDLVCRISGTIDLQYDVAHFEEQAKGALGLRPHDPRRVELLASAANLYTGEYLADLSVDWLMPRREELSALQIQVLREYADELMALTRYSEARSVLAEALAVEPFQDELHERMLICLGKIGQRHEVVNYYRRYRETLRNELGIEPPHQIRALYSRLLE